MSFRNFIQQTKLPFWRSNLQGIVYKINKFIQPKTQGNNFSASVSKTVFWKLKNKERNGYSLCSQYISMLRTCAPASPFPCSVEHTCVHLQITKQKKNTH